jgi:hypothetical protein
VAGQLKLTTKPRLGISIDFWMIRTSIPGNSSSVPVFSAGQTPTSISGATALNQLASFAFVAAPSG